MILQALAGISFPGLFVNPGGYFGNFLFQDFTTSLSAASLLSTSRSLELVVGSRKLAKVLSTSSLFGQASTYLLGLSGSSYQVNSLNLVVTSEVLYYAYCPYLKILQLTPNINIGSGTLVILTVAFMSKTPNDVFNVLASLSYCLIYLAWTKPSHETP